MLPGLLVQQELLDLLVQRELPGLLDLPGHEVQMGQKEPLDQQVQLVLLVKLGLLEQQQQSLWEP